MTILALGLNHDSAPVAVRERIALSTDAISTALDELRARHGVAEAAILSTCNRTELYCRTEPQAADQPSEWLHGYHDMQPGELEPFLYRHDNEAAVRHVLRVATGLDSMVLGEPEILGQMKVAWQQARSAESLGTPLDRLFQHAFAAAKRIRTETAIGQRPVSVASTAVAMARQLFGDYASQTVMLIGAGETIELTARHLTAQNVGQLLIANRTLHKAQELANRFGGSAVSLDRIDDCLCKADVVFSSTAATTPLLGPSQFQHAIGRRRRKPMFVVDLAVPRDIEAAVSELPDVYVYTMDDIQNAAEMGRANRRSAAREAEHLIEHQVDRYMNWLSARRANHSIRHYRERAEAWRDEELQKARQQLVSGRDPDEVLGRLAHNLTQRLLHGPSSQMREAAASGRDDVLQIANLLLDLETGSKTPNPEPSERVKDDPH